MLFAGKALDFTEELFILQVSHVTISKKKQIRHLQAENRRTNWVPSHAHQEWNTSSQFRKNVVKRSSDAEFCREKLDHYFRQTWLIYEERTTPMDAGKTSPALLPLWWLMRLCSKDDFDSSVGISAFPNKDKSFPSANVAGLRKWCSDWTVFYPLARDEVNFLRDARV